MGKERFPLGNHNFSNVCTIREAVAEKDGKELKTIGSGNIATAYDEVGAVSIADAVDSFNPDANIFL